MTTHTLDDRLSQSRKTFENKYAFPATIGIIIVLIVIWAGSKYFVTEATSYWMNLLTEGVGIAITILVIDRLNEYRRAQERKLELFRQAKSRSNNAALEAVDQILHDGLWDTFLEHYRNNKGLAELSYVRWSGDIELRGFNLENVNMWYAHLQNTNLKEANFQNSILFHCYLENANLEGANLKNTDLEYNHLENANLEDAHLENARLKYTHLENANLGSANLEHANLSYAHLENANLGHAKLDRAFLRETHLENARLVETSLKNTQMDFTHLQNADLWEANLENANLWKANFENANLHDAYLRGAKYIESAFFNEKTVLPDAVPVRDEKGWRMYDEEGHYTFSPESYWTPETDMTRYTDPNHPDFWEPDWVKEAREKNT